MNVNYSYHFPQTLNLNLDHIVKCFVTYKYSQLSRILRYGSI